MSLVGKDDLEELIFDQVALATYRWYHSKVRKYWKMTMNLSRETAVEKAEEGMDDYRSPWTLCLGL